MNINNMFDFSNKSIRVNNTVMCIYELAFYITIVAINDDNLTYNYYSDEWLYLINYNYPNAGFYNFFVEKYNHLITEIHSNDVVYYDKHVVSLLTTFCRGSVHGYSGFWYSLITYINNIENYDELDIIMYKDCDAGMLSIVNHLCNVGVIIKPIIFLEKNVKYKFSSITYIVNDYHVFNGELEKMVTTFITQFFVSHFVVDAQSNRSKPYISTPPPLSGESRSILNGNWCKKYNIIDPLYEKKNHNICIIKSDKSNTNISYNGIFNDAVVEKFCNQYNIYRLFPSNEIELINLIYNCKILILNYGSTFFKNYVYISDICEKIIVVVNGDGYINDYNYLSSITSNKYQGIIYKKYKNAYIKYIIVNNDLPFDPFEY